MYLLKMEEDIQDLLLKTTCAGALGIAGAEVVRTGFHRFVMKRFLSGSKYSVQIHDFTHSAISAFILILTSYEKAVLLKKEMRFSYYFLTFILGILFSRIFSSSNPSPFFQLQKHWKVIRQGSLVKPKRGKITGSNSIAQMASEYFSFAWPSLLGQFTGLLVAIRWMKVYWDGWVTSHHETHLPMLDECIWCLNTGVIWAFLIETAATFSYLYLFEAIDSFQPPHDGAGKLLGSSLIRNSIKSVIVIFGMLLFLDVTGCFTNPFHAFAMQRHCFDDVTTTASLIFVYVLGPLLGTVGYLLRWGDRGLIGKAKRSV